VVGGGSTILARPVPVIPNPIPPTPQLRGEVHGAATADFDLDGDTDVVTAEAFLFGRGPEGSFVTPDAPSTNRIFLNNDNQANAADGDTNGFGTMLFFNEEQAGGDVNGDGIQNNAGAFSPNSARNSFQVLVDDVDRDGDQDVVFINASSGHQYYENQLITAPPDLETDDDVPMRSITSRPSITSASLRR
jgi:hypothetical protein